MQDLDFPESHEVTTQRIRDLAKYVKEKMSFLFSSLDKEIEDKPSKSTILLMTSDLGDEFGENTLNTYRLVREMCSYITSFVSPHVYAAMESTFNTLDEDDEDVVVTSAVIWESYFPNFSESDFNESFTDGYLIAAQALTSILHSIMQDEPGWHLSYLKLCNIGDRIAGEDFWGWFGVMLVSTYIQVKDYKVLPQIEITHS